MKKNLIYLFIILCAFSVETVAQETDLESLLDEEMGATENKVFGTFLSTFILNNHSVEVLNKNGINFRISHKFDYLNTGAEECFGFDKSTVFMGVEFAPTDWMNIGIGRGTFRESFNGMMKIKILQQTEGSKNIPVSLVAFGEMVYRTNNYINEDLQNDRIGRLEYTSQLLIARKIGNLFSLQLMPGYVHRNLVETNEEKNGIASLGLGGSYKLLKRLRLNAEYFFVQDHDTPTQDYYSPISVGMCYQSSRHSFEVFATNSTGIASNNHIAYTTGNFWKGDICIGFNISIIFSVKK